MIGNNQKGQYPIFLRYIKFLREVNGTELANLLLSLQNNLYWNNYVL